MDLLEISEGVMTKVGLSTPFVSLKQGLALFRDRFKDALFREMEKQLRSLDNQRFSLTESI